MTLKLIIILIPGAIGCLIFEKLTIHKKWNSFRFILNSIILGSVVYLGLQLLYYLFFKINFWTCLPVELHILSIWSNLSDVSTIPYIEVLYASLLSIVFGYITSFVEQKKLINRLGKKLKVSNKFGDENLYTHFLNADEIVEVYVRDIKNNLTYHGLVNYFSENDDIREIVLSNVSVYRYTDSEFLYDIDKIYLSKPKDDIIIESIKNNQNGTERSTKETPN